jgi:hypothetical protein
MARDCHLLGGSVIDVLHVTLLMRLCATGFPIVAMETGEMRDEKENARSHSGRARVVMIWVE